MPGGHRASDAPALFERGRGPRARQPKQGDAVTRDGPVAVSCVRGVRKVLGAGEGRRDQWIHTSFPPDSQDPHEVASQPRPLALRQPEPRPYWQPMPRAPPQWREPSSTPYSVIPKRVCEETRAHSFKNLFTQQRSVDTRIQIKRHTQRSFAAERSTGVFHSTNEC